MSSIATFATSFRSLCSSVCTFAGRILELRHAGGLAVLYSLNPVVGVIDGFRWCLLGGESQLYLPGFVLSLGVVAFFLWLGIAYFRRTERTFADLI